MAVVPSCRKADGGGRASSQPAGKRPRVITFSPALTSIVFEMGLGGHVVGVSAFSNLPEGQTRPVAGDRQNINAERIAALAGDLLLIQQNPRDFDLIRRIDPRIGIEHFTIEKLDDIASAVERIGKLAGEERIGLESRRRFEGRLADVRRRVAGLPVPRVLFLTGVDPPSVAGRDSFIHEMIELAGGQDVTAKYQRWTQINVERMLTAGPEVVICQADKGRQAQAREFLAGLKDMPAAQSGRIFVVSDPRWTVPSMHLADLAGELAEMIHPELSPTSTRGANP
jgi:iron complex transport system substrate-binding protein